MVKKTAWVKLIGLLVVVLALVVLAVWNAEPTPVRIPFFEPVRLSKSLLLAVTFLLGFVAGIIATFLIGARAKKKKQ